jgi:nucleoid-associated protein YgaU|tara:strand:- start:64 stop:363 length:300 start_codon:yes stop_codon:yes gene_type:complete
MENRYQNIKILKTEEGKRYRKTIEYPKMEKTVDDKYIIGMQGDRLDNLAHKYYGDARLWWILARANYLGKGDLSVPIGKQLRIPKDYLSIMDEYRTLNK